MKLRKKLDINECTDNPPLRKSSYLTDDDSAKDVKIMDMSDSSTNIDKMTEAEYIQKTDQENMENDQRQIADTVIDSMCTRVSVINVKSPKQGISESLDFGLDKKTLADTVIDSQNSSRVLQEIDAPFSARKSLFRTKRDSFSSDELMIGKNVSFKKSLTSPNPQITDDYSEDEVIEVLDTDEEQEIDLFQPAELKSRDSFVNCSSSAGTLDDFFNNPPLLPSNVAVTNSLVKPYKAEEDDVINTSFPLEVGPKNSNFTFRQSRKISEVRRTISFNDNEHVEIGPTDESDIDEDIVDLTLDKSSPKVNAQQNNNDHPKTSKSNPISVNLESATRGSSNIRTKHRNITNINIKFDLKISIRDGSASECSDDNHNETVSSEKSSVKGDYLKAITVAPNFEPKTPEKDNSNAGLDESNLNTPKRDPMTVIDKELQSMLDDLYGNGWKTPQVMSSFKIKRYREELRKSLAANNFESFVGNLANDLESTRISSPKTEKPVRKIVNKPVTYSNIKDENLKKGSSSTHLKIPNHQLTNDDNKEKENSKKNIRSAIKTRQVNKNVPKTPLHQLCDPETESEDSDSEKDVDFNPDDTWNASSDEEYQSEKDRIKKRQSVKQTDMIFTLDDSLNEILKKYEFKPQPQIEVAEKPPRRKLFTHSHFDDDEEDVTPKKDIPKTPIIDPKKKESDKKQVTPRDIKKTPTTTGKTLKVFESTPKNIGSTPKVPGSLTKTPSLIDNPLSKKEALKRFSKYTFLKSLDAEANKLLCDPEALNYRENYKTKKCELADKLFKLYNEKVFNLQLSDVPIKWNKKLQTTGGRCNNSRRAGIRNSLVELSDKVLTSADRLRCTLIHEMCHAAAWILNGENGHGVTWKSWTAKANSIFPELPKITVCHSYVIEYKYTYLCMSCKARSQTHSKTKKVEDVRCSMCKGSIQLFENKKNKDGVLELVPVQRKEPTAFAKFVKLKFKEVKKPHLSHKEVMQILSAQFSNLGVDEKAQL